MGYAIVELLSDWYESGCPELTVLVARVPLTELTASGCCRFHTPAISTVALTAFSIQNSATGLESAFQF